ncbi:alpha-galactosidase [Sanguibacter gelidistatuariae]|uniref:Alpha-galactosidase n=1 Tax=Sanguibacter gelidistatuariae TaxID=1814289 RepID=A0A1G6HFS6_9MICO|nr:glycoside hydrolase family 27 protein [Sanguibacter gelidistatuariae]SDB92775.1 alpha-galactosidase [Sanguibacter gelidistatuariae]
MDETTFVKDATLVPTPPMGWNSWNTFRCYDLTETVVLGVADALVTSGMRNAGYTTLVIDDCWQDVARDPAGRLCSHPRRFPSGMAALGEEIHARGLRFGLYLAPGRKTCAMIYDRYPAREIGSFGHEELDAATLAEWGVDYLKYDWCRANKGGTGLTYAGAFERMAHAIAATGRPIVYSISEYGRSRPWEWAGELGHLWRTTSDIAPTWRSVMRLADKQHGLAAYAGPGGWNDPDMLEVGNPGLSDLEARSHLMLWAMLAAPLMAGNDVRTMTEETRALLTHPGLLAVSQDPLGRQGARTTRHGKVDVWRRDLVDGWVVGVLNRGSCPTTLRLHDAALSLGTDAAVEQVPGSGCVVDVWTGRELRGGGDHSWELAPHEMVLVRFAP